MLPRALLLVVCLLIIASPQQSAGQVVFFELPDEWPDDQYLVEIGAGYYLGVPWGYESGSAILGMVEGGEYAGQHPDSEYNAIFYWVSREAEAEAVEVEEKDTETVSLPLYSIVPVSSSFTSTFTSSALATRLLSETSSFFSVNFESVIELKSNVVSRV